MNKKTALLLSALIILGTAANVYAADKSGISKETIPTAKELTPPVEVSVIEYNPALYKNPNLNHAVQSYKNGNYTGTAQELFAYLEAHPEDAKAFYYLAMTMANLGDTDAAIEAYEKVLALTNEEGLRMLASKGRDCLTGGPLCSVIEEMDPEDEEEPDPLDEFVKAPYGNGFSPELNDQIKLQELETIQKNINRKPELSPEEIQQIKDFDEKHSGYGITGEKLALADGQVSNDDIVSAINTLRQAGMTVSIQPSATNAYYNPQMSEMSMMLGQNNNTNNDPMSQMLPYLMQAGTKDGAQNVDPQVIQAMMMNSMMSNLDFNSSNDK